MAARLRDRIVENLAVGSALGLLTLIIAALSLIVDSRSIAMERRALASPTSSNVELAGKVDDPAFERIYSFGEGAPLNYAIVLSLRSPDDSALVAAEFSPRGELVALNYLGSCSSRLPVDPKDSLPGFVGSEEALQRAGEAVRIASHGGAAGNSQEGS